MMALACLLGHPLPLGCSVRPSGRLNRTRRRSATHSRPSWQAAGLPLSLHCCPPVLRRPALPRPVSMPPSVLAVAAGRLKPGRPPRPALLPLLLPQQSMHGGPFLQLVHGPHTAGSLPAAWRSPERAGTPGSGSREKARRGCVTASKPLQQYRRAGIPAMEPVKRLTVDPAALTTVCWLA